MDPEWEDISKRIREMQQYKHVEGEQYNEQREDGGMNLEWEDIGNRVQRLRVPGGWLVRTSTYDSTQVNFALVNFVPDPGHRWHNFDPDPDITPAMPSPVTSATIEHDGGKYTVQIARWDAKDDASVYVNGKLMSLSSAAVDSADIEYAGVKHTVEIDESFSQKDGVRVYLDGWYLGYADKQ